MGYSVYRSDGHTTSPGPDEIVSNANMAVNVSAFESVDGISQAAVDFAKRELDKLKGKKVFRLKLGKYFLELRK